MKRVLFGGTFDPVHNGHISAVKTLRQDYDEVIVMPAALSPFKTETSASDADRVAMLHLAFDGMDGVTVDCYELEQGGVSYTYQTLKKYNDCDLALGGDSMASLHTWTNVDKIRENTRVVVIDRAGAPCEDAIEQWNALGGRAVMIGDAPRASSSLARLQLGLERKSPILPSKIEQYCNERGLYGDWDEILSLYPRFKLTEKRVAHTFGVAYTALALAEKFGADKNQSVRAALLHDLAKYLSVEDAEAMGVKVDERALQAEEGVRHAYIGADVAQQLLREQPEIVAAVRYHTTGRAGMTLLEKIVCLADYIEPSRYFCGVELIREAAETDLDYAVALMLELTKKHLVEHGKPIDPLGEEAYEFYKPYLNKEQV